MNENTFRAFLNSGKLTELAFTKCLDDNNYCWSAATRKQDIEEHWDVSVHFDGEPVLVDVKGMKKVWRYDPTPNENYHYIEILNVQGKPGWLYGSAGFIAFETENYWLLVDTDKLRDMVSKLVKKEQVDKPTLYKIYRREGRLDVMTLVKTMDIIIYTKPIIIYKNAK